MTDSILTGMTGMPPDPNTALKGELEAQGDRVNAIEAELQKVREYAAFLDQREARQEQVILTQSEALVRDTAVDYDDKLEFVIGLATKDLEKSGLSPADARQAAAQEIVKQAHATGRDAPRYVLELADKHDYGHYAINEERKAADDGMGDMLTGIQKEAGWI